MTGCYILFIIFIVTLANLNTTKNTILINCNLYSGTKTHY
jgi:hypothetical protein